MTKIEKKLIKLFLRMASDEYANHGTNDLNLSLLIPNLKARRKFVKKYHEWNGDPEEYDETRDYTYFPDFALMSYMASRVK